MSKSSSVWADRRHLLEYLLPGAAVDLMRTLRLRLQNPGYSRLTAANAAWRNRFAGQSVYVLGNGPSLAAVDRGLYRGKPVIVMNAFERAEWKAEMKIVAHCLGEPRQSPSWGEHMYASIAGTEAQSYWLHFSAFADMAEQAARKPLHFVFPSVEAGLWRDSRPVRLERSTLGYATTAQLAIQVALYMGFSEIFLLGFDHDWLASPKYSRHFYSSEKDAEDTLDQHSYLSIMEFSRRMWTIYYKLRGIAAAHGATIYNLSPGSYLDVFPFASPERLAVSGRVTQSGGAD